MLQREGEFGPSRSGTLNVRDGSLGIRWALYEQPPPPPRCSPSLDSEPRHSAGRWVTLVVTPGGQRGLDRARPFATAAVRAASNGALPPALRLRVLVWDRRNIGGSGVSASTWLGLGSGLGLGLGLGLGFGFG